MKNHLPFFEKQFSHRNAVSPFFPASRRAQHEQRDEITSPRGKSNQSSSLTDFLVLKKKNAGSSLGRIFLCRIVFVTAEFRLSVDRVISLPNAFIL
jgi:hypothetical protein